MKTKSSFIINKIKQNVFYLVFFPELQSSCSLTTENTKHQVITRCKLRTKFDCRKANDKFLRDQKW